MAATAQPLLPGVPPPTIPEDPDRRYTLRSTLDWCMRTAGVDAFDLDVAADAEAHVCERYFTVADNGLEQQWTGRVWCNPPYSDIEPWLVKAWEEMTAGRADLVAMLIPSTRSEQAFWQRHVEPFRDGKLVREGIALTTHNLPGRQPFGHPGNLLGVNVGSPEFGVVELIWRHVTTELKAT